MQTKCRQEFEKWAKKTGYNIDYNQGELKEHYPYMGTPTTRAYNAWCAAWEAAQKCEHGDIRTVQIKQDGSIIDPRKKD
jgi:hypothetical protein